MVLRKFFIYEKGHKIDSFKGTVFLLLYFIVFLLYIFLQYYNWQCFWLVHFTSCYFHISFVFRSCIGYNFSAFIARLFEKAESKHMNHFISVSAIWRWFILLRTILTCFVVQSIAMYSIIQKLHDILSIVQLNN